MADVVDNLTMFTNVRGSNPSKVQLCSFSLLSKVTSVFFVSNAIETATFLGSQLGRQVISDYISRSTSQKYKLQRYLVFYNVPKKLGLTVTIHDVTNFCTCSPGED